MTHNAIASDLADYLTRQIPTHGSISTAEARRVLFRLNNGLSAEQIMHAIAVAVCRRQIYRDHGGATLRRGK